MIKNIVGILFIIIGVSVGVYLGLWVMFIGGILMIARAIDAHILTATLLATNIIKIFFASFVGAFIGYIGSALGMVIIDN